MEKRKVQKWKIWFVRVMILCADPFSHATGKCTGSGEKELDCEGE